MLRYEVRAKPGSRRGPLVEQGPDAVLTVHVKERAVDGAANDAVVAALAAHFGVRRTAVRIVRGHTARLKLVEVDHEPTSGR
ncbi:DUF167 domain-containing protein [Demequina sp.]|uniref:DUF167 domain-containing protein n=1 Tax=Demequina sp. TaxID=2050685 RepID=UPI003D0A9775